MDNKYPFAVDIRPLVRYMTQERLQSELEGLFELRTKPWNKCWGFSVWLGASWPNSVLFTKEEEAAKYVEFLNETYKVENFLFIEEPFQVTKQGELA